MKVAHVTQGSPEWWKVRKGIPTASEFSRIIKASAVEIEIPIETARDFVDRGCGIWDGCPLAHEELVQLGVDLSAATKARKYARFTGYKASEGQDGYIAEIIAGALGWESNFQGTPDTERGNRMEKQALRWLAYQHGIKTCDVGFLLSDDGTHGASPDAMVVGCNVPVEVKAPDLHTFIKWKIAGGLPEQHKAQVHGEMFVAGADRAIFVAYAEHPVIENMMVEVKRDSFTDKIGPALEKFTQRLREIEELLITDDTELEIYREGLAKGRTEALTLTP